MARFIMIVVLSGIVTYGISNITQNSNVSQGTDNTVDNFIYNRAHDIASSMTDILLMRIANDWEYRVETDEEPPEPLFGGDATYAVEDTFFGGDTLIKIKVAAKIKVAENDYVTKTIITYAQRPTDGWVPPFIRGAWTANANLNNTISDMLIDGRDHDLDLNILPTTGVHGVSSSQPFVNVEGAQIGGTNNFIDYPMTFPEDSAVIEEEYDWDGGFPETPDGMLGYPEGTLKAAAQSGLFGSQYLLLPPNEGTIDGNLLTYPLSGVTYVEVQNGDGKDLVIEQTGNSGILVIHRDIGDSYVSSIKADKSSDGLLTGLLITDKSFHHHIDILGAVLMLSTDLITNKNCSGNADHWVYYSSEAVVTATHIAAEITGLSEQVGYGFGKKRIKVRHVYE